MTNRTMFHRYTAPEIIHNYVYAVPKDERFPYTAKVDVWSMGVLLYNMLSGDFPFGNEDETLENDLEFRNAIWKFISPKTKKFIGTLLVRADWSRPSVTEVLRNNWFSASAILKAHEVMGTLMILPPPSPQEQPELPASVTAKRPRLN